MSSEPPGGTKHLTQRDKSFTLTQLAVIITCVEIERLLIPHSTDPSKANIIIRRPAELFKPRLNRSSSGIRIGNLICRLGLCLCLDTRPDPDLSVYGSFDNGLVVGREVI